MAPNFSAPALLPSFCRHAPPLRFWKTIIADKSCWGAKGSKKQNKQKNNNKKKLPPTTRTHADHHWNASRPHLQPETEIKVGAQMFPEQINLDYASSGRKAEKTD